MLTILTNGTKRKVAQCWGEVTTEQAQEICKRWNCVDKIQLFNILTGTEYAAVRESTDLGSTFWNVVHFALFPAEVKNAKMPKILKVNGKILEIPKKVGRLTIGQSIAVRQAMERVQLRIESDMKAMEGEYRKFCFTPDFLFDELCSFACAVYLQPLYDGTAFDDERALELEKDILRLPIKTVYPIGFFFLNQQLSYGKKSIWGYFLNLVMTLRKGRR